MKNALLYHIELVTVVDSYVILYTVKLTLTCLQSDYCK